MKEKPNGWWSFNDMEEIKKDFLNGKTPKAFLTLLKSAKLKNFTIRITTILFFYLTTRFNRVRLERSKHERIY